MRKSDAVGAALRVARAEGGKVVAHIGPIKSAVAGRTDHLPMQVPSGSYVLPADIVSSLGEGNTLAGFKVLHRMFDGLPYGSKGGTPYGGSSAPYGGALPTGKAEGGATKGVGIVAAGGEHVVTPEQVMALGEGDLDLGHRVLDEFVKRQRKGLIKTLTKLPGPRRN